MEETIAAYLAHEIEHANNVERLRKKSNSMEQSSSWEASRSLASQEIPRILYKLKIY
jgi:hypothetical protein